MKKGTKLIIAAVTLFALLLVAAAVVWLGGRGAGKFYYQGEGQLKAEYTKTDWLAEDISAVVPGLELEKELYVTNTGHESEYIALKISFLDEQGNALTMEQMSVLLSIMGFRYGEESGFNSTQWMLIDSAENRTATQTWLYMGTDAKQVQAIEPGVKTETLYDRLVFGNDISQEQINWLRGEDLTLSNGETIPGVGKFTLYVEGAALQDAVYEPEQIALIADALYRLVNA